MGFHVEFCGTSPPQLVKGLLICRGWWCIQYGRTRIGWWHEPAVVMEMPSDAGRGKKTGLALHDNPAG